VNKNEPSNPAVVETQVSPAAKNVVEESKLGQAQE